MSGINAVWVFQVIRPQDVLYPNLEKDGDCAHSIAFLHLVRLALQAAEALDATVANMRFVKPLDEGLVLELADSHELIVTVEENVIQGGAGSAVLEALERHQRAVPVLQLGLPDRFIDHGDPGIQLAECGLTAEGIVRSIRERFAS